MRTTTIIDPRAEMADVKDIISKIMITRGYVFKDKKQYWQKGSGWLAAPSFFNFKVVDGKLHVETWIKTALLPGVYIGESGLDNQMGFAIKIPMRKILRDIIEQTSRSGLEPQGYVPAKK